MSTVWAGAELASAQAPKPPRDWNQPHGNAANSAACDVEPVRGPPNEAWRTKFDAILAGPVISGDRLFVAVREGRERRLLALQPATLLEQGRDPRGELGRRRLEQCRGLAELLLLGRDMGLGGSAGQRLEPPHPGGHRPFADDWHQAFKWQRVAQLPRDGFRLPRQAVIDWADRARAAGDPQAPQPW